MTSTDRLTTALAGRYQIERQLGAGGMATVYLAADVKHDRKVAVKVLRPELAAVLGGDRFVQEIKTTAQLQHPHILPLFDSGEADGFLFYVMPYIEGETLRDKLNREGQLGVDVAVKITIDVADGLQYAHTHGVIHRDIKPENILLQNGRPMVADFGIALAVSQAGTGRLTETGLSIGTPHYMSPEQAMGERNITTRSDVYSLGVMAYEMLAGQPPFTGPSSQAIVASVLTEEPGPLSTQRHGIPRNVEAAVLRALEKRSADRFATPAEFAAALADSTFTHGLAPGPSGRALLRPGARLPWLLLLVALGYITGHALWPRPTPALPPVYRFNVLLPAHAASVSDVFSVPALSPDGTTLVYNGRDSTGHRWLFLRAMDRLDPVPVPGSENGVQPFLSPDGRWIGFILGTRIVRAPVAGGLPEAVCDAGTLVRATWLERNVIIFADDTGLKQCSMTGQVLTLAASDSGDSYNSPHALPGDHAIVFSIRRDAVTRLATLDLRTNAIRSLGVMGDDPRYVATGHLMYVSPDGLVRAVTFDPVAVRVTGEPVIIDEGIRIDYGAAMMAVSRSGTIVTTQRVSLLQALELVDRAGVGRRLSPRLGAFAHPRISPDGRWIATALGTSIWMLDRSQGAFTRLTFDTTALRPAWSLDGQAIAYVRQVGTQNDLRLARADGSTPARSLRSVPDREPWEVLFAPDGTSLVVRTVGGSGRRDIWRVPLDTGDRALPLLESPADETSPAVSPDGRWLAYVSNESGRAEVYVRAFPSMGARFPVSLDGGSEPVWSPRGNELFYRSGPEVMAAEVRAGPTFEVLRRTRLFSSPDYATDLTHPSYDVTRDGQHFVMVRDLGGASYLTVILNRLARVGPGGADPAPAASFP